MTALDLENHPGEYYLLIKKDQTFLFERATRTQLSEAEQEQVFVPCGHCGVAVRSGTIYRSQLGQFLRWIRKLYLAILCGACSLSALPSGTSVHIKINTDGGFLSDSRGRLSILPFLNRTKELQAPVDSSGSFCFCSTCSLNRG